MNQFDLMFSTLTHASRTARKSYHVTLGEAISFLEEVAPSTELRFSDSSTGPEAPHSYRGYYEDLAFERGPVTNVEHFLALCKAAWNDTFTGYKGGDFVMGNDTPLWASSYGMTGSAIILIEIRDGVVVLVTKDVD